MVLEHNNAATDVEKEKEKDNEKEKEVEEGNLEEEKERISAKDVLQKYWILSIKFLELVFCCMSLAFVFEPTKEGNLGAYQLHHVGFMYTTFAGYILIIVCFFAGRAVGDRIPFKTCAILSIMGTILHIITAIFLIFGRFILMRRYSYQERGYLASMMTASITFSFINAGIFTLDAVVTVVRKQDF